MTAPNERPVIDAATREADAAFIEGLRFWSVGDLDHDSAAPYSASWARPRISSMATCSLCARLDRLAHLSRQVVELEQAARVLLTRVQERSIPILSWEDDLARVIDAMRRGPDHA